MSDFDEKEYWLARHERLRGDLRAVGNISRTTAEVEGTLRNAAKLLSLVVTEIVPERRGRSVLDFGCGVGRLAPVLQAVGLQYTGVDVSPVAIEQARTAYPEAKFEVADVVSHASHRRFDLVVIHSVLLHLVRDADWFAALEFVSRALRDDGHLILHDTLPEVAPQEQPSHVNFRTLRTYRDEMEKTGLRFVPGWLEGGRSRMAEAIEVVPRALGNLYLIERADCRREMSGRSLQGRERYAQPG